MKWLVTIGMIIWLSAATGQPTDLFEQANTAYAEEEWTVAIDNYEEILQSDYRSAAVHFNLANAYYQMGELGQAILHYERAWQLDPTDEDINFNKKLANLQIIDKVTPKDPTIIGAWWEGFLLSASTNTWTYTAILFFILTLVLGAVFLFMKHAFWRPFSFFGALATLAIALLMTLMAHQRYQVTYPPTPRAIIMAPNVYVKSAPKANSTDLFILHEGLKVTVQEEDGEWCRVGVENDKQGWVKRSDLAII